MAANTRKDRTATAIAVSILMAICLFASCTDRPSTVYFHYEPVPKTVAEGSGEGWDVRDSIVFHTDTIPCTATYTTYLCLRLSEDYPYANLSALVSLYSPALTRKTASIATKRENGTPGGNGLNCYTYEVPIATGRMQQGDSLRIVVSHRMRREVLPGVMDVGIKIKRAEDTEEQEDTAKKP